MGGCHGRNNATTRNIDKRIVDYKKQIRSEFKLLLLGAGESGKSTFAKQMKILHLGGFSEEERIYFKHIIFENLLYSVRSVIKGCEKNSFLLQKKNKEIAEQLLDISITEVTEEMAAEIKAIYEDDAVKSLMKCYNAFHLLDSTQYFLSDIDRIVQQDYIPTVDDLLRCRAKTTGVQEIQIEIERAKFIIVDVGGQRSERKKWIHCFQDVTVVLFFVALSEYDQFLYEDDDTNRIHESLKLFDEICNSRWFSAIPIVLFLNKCDLFQEKIKLYPITVAFPDYLGKQEYDEAAKFIELQFVALNENPEKMIFPHVTCATNTENIRVVFDSIKSVVLQATWVVSGF